MCGSSRGTIGRFAHLSSPRAVAQEKSPFGQAVCCRFLANATLLSPGLAWPPPPVISLVIFETASRSLGSPGAPRCPSRALPPPRPRCQPPHLSASSYVIGIVRLGQLRPRGQGGRGSTSSAPPASLSPQGHHADKAARTAEEEAKAGRRKEYGMARGPLYH